MGITIKDGVTTFFAILIGILTYFQIHGFQLPFFSNVRFTSLLVICIGMLMCLFESKSVYSEPTSDPLLLVVTVLGCVALVVGIMGIISGKIVLLEILAGIILFLWLLSTVRHILSR